MRKIIFLALAYLPFMIACSVDDVLKSSDGVRLALMETVDTVRAIPGDTVSFKFIASTNVGQLERVEVTNKSHKFQDLRDSIRFSLVDNTTDLTIDAAGYLSRPTTTIMMIYPLVVPTDQNMVGEVLSMTFKVFNSKGKSGSIKSCFKIINYRINATWQYFYNPYGNTTGTMFYNPDKHKGYTNKTFVENLDVIDIVAYTDVSGKHYCMNPAARETEEAMVGDGFVYSAAKMRNTKFIRLDQVNYGKIADLELNAMNFANATDQMEINAGSVIGFMNQDGRKGVMNVKIQSGYVMIQTKFQALSK